MSDTATVTRIASASGTREVSASHDATATVAQTSAQVREYLDRLIQGVQEAMAPQWDQHTEAGSLLYLALDRVGCIRSALCTEVLDDRVADQVDQVMVVDALLAGAEAIGCAKPQITAMRALCDELHGLLDQPRFWPPPAAPTQADTTTPAAPTQRVPYEFCIDTAPLTLVAKALDMQSNNDESFNVHMDPQEMLELVEENMILRDAALMYLRTFLSEIDKKGLVL